METEAEERVLTGEPGVLTGQKGDEKENVEGKTTDDCVKEDKDRPMQNCRFDMERLPEDILGEIFLNLTLKERHAVSLMRAVLGWVEYRKETITRLCHVKFYYPLTSDNISLGYSRQVCHRWYAILTGGRFGLDNVVVLNLFESGVWTNNMRSGRVSCSPLQSMDQLATIIRHFTVTNSIKFWFRDPRFVTNALKILEDAKLRVKCIDIYPYGDNTPLDECLSTLSTASALTVRPHGNDYFWDGLTLKTMPTAPHLDTLILDSVNLDPSISLPKNISTLEWCNRRSASFYAFRDQLSTLRNLEYLSLSHVEFKTIANMNEFLEVVSYKNMPLLRYLVFRFCHFPILSEDQTKHRLELLSFNESEPQLRLLKVVKLDLCSGNLHDTINLLLSVTSKELRILSANCIYEDLDMKQVYSLVPLLRAREVSLQFGVLQKMDRSNISHASDNNNNGDVVENGLNNAEIELERNMAALHGAARRSVGGQYPHSLLIAPVELRHILWKIDMSFCDDLSLLMSLVSPITDGPFVSLLELKFIQCKAVNDDFLALVAKHCVRVRKITLIKCENVSHSGIRAFVCKFQETCTSTESPPPGVPPRAHHLTILWKHTDHPAVFYLELLREYRCLLSGLRSRFMTKSLPGEMTGERVLFWPAKPPTRTLSIQNYGESELCSVIGFAIDWQREVEAARALLAQEDDTAIDGESGNVDDTTDMEQDGVGDHNRTPSDVVDDANNSANVNQSQQHETDNATSVDQSDNLINKGLLWQSTTTGNNDEDVEASGLISTSSDLEREAIPQSSNVEKSPTPDTQPGTSHS